MKKNYRSIISLLLLLCLLLLHPSPALAGSCFLFEADLSAVNITDNDESCGLYVYETASSFDSNNSYLVEDTKTDGMAVIIHPLDQTMESQYRDVVNWTLKTTKAVTLPWPLTSFGLPFTEKAVIFQANGTFDLNHPPLDSVSLKAKGHGAKFTFNHLCAVPYDGGDSGGNDIQPVSDDYPNAAPTMSLTAVDYGSSTLVNPADIPVTVAAVPLLIQPTMTVATIDRGQTAYLFAYIYLPQISTGFNFSAPQPVTLGAEANFSTVFPRMIDMAGQDGFVFDVYYGYTLNDGNIHYNAYEVTLGSGGGGNNDLATDYYVATSGNDSNSGTINTPWKTIQHAAESLAAGDTVYVRAGIYHETVSINVSGSAGSGSITLRNYPGETPILDGTGFTDPDGDCGFYIDSQSYLIIQGFEIRNYQTSTANAMPMAIRIEGAAHHIQLLDNSIHHIASTAPLDKNLLGRDAHGIGVYGTSAGQAITDLLIRGNELAELTLGSSEALVLNGNVNGFTISNNLIHDIDNIGIDLIGFEETVSDPVLDRARNGLVAENRVYNVDSGNNPSYNGERSADGIYVDGGLDIIIERNRIDSANFAIEIASEHSNGNASGITVRNNFISRSHNAGIVIGGYDENRGHTDNCAIVNNTLYHNDSDQSGSGELLLNYDTRNTVIKNNIIVAGRQNLLIDNTFTANQGNTVDYNLFYAPGGAAASEWEWQNNSYTGFTAYQNATGNDSHSIFIDPLLADPANQNLHILNNSPARDAGDNTAPAGDRDIDGQNRILNNRIELGADELRLLTGNTRPDGAVRIAVTASGSLQNPAWSPDSGQLLFTSFRNGYNLEPADLMIHDLSSQQDTTLVADNSGNINLPGSAWNGSSGQIIFSSSRDPHDEIYRIPAAGHTGDEVQVTSRSNLVAYEPSLAPAGDWLVFESHQLNVEGNGIIVKYKIDGSQPYTALTATGDDCRQPNWSPEGNRILFQRSAGGQWDIWVMNTDGTDKLQVTSGPGDKTDASFSPDGSRIVYSSDQGGLAHANLFVIAASGGTPSRLTRNEQGYDGAPSWSGDGHWIAFESCTGDPEETGTTAIWKIAAPL